VGRGRRRLVVDRVNAVDEVELHARVALCRIAEPGDAKFGAWVDEHGPVELLDRLRSAHSGLVRAERYLARVEGVDVDAQVRSDIDAAEHAGAALVVPGTSGWPQQLDDLGTRRPLLLWVRGPADLRLAALHSVAVVGARASTRYGDRIAGELAAGLAEHRWTVVSGGAYGIDAAAHAGALVGGGVTVAVLATGVDQTYPRGNDALLARVLDSGLLVSELHPGARPWRSRFLERNRVIAALTRGTVVVEAAARSGAISTATRAADLNRHVMGVPGPVTSPMSSGVHDRIREGSAVLVTGVADVLELVAPVGEVASLPPPHDTPRALDGLDPRLRALHEPLSVRRPLELAAVARAAGVPEAEALSGLGELVLRGLAERTDDGWRARRCGGA
jgi:DNA processing protein